MGVERISGNGNFDVDAIRLAASAIENAPAAVNEQDQPSSELSTDDQRAVSAILDIVAEFAANRSAGSGNELEAMLVTAIAAKLPAGTHSQIIGEIFREVERRDRSGFAEFGAEQWERVKKEAKEERERLDKAIDLADSAQQLGTTPDRFGNSQQDYADLNTELKSRDGQERYMAFLRLLHPNMNDAQIRERMEKTAAIAARESNQPLTERQQDLLENMPPAEEAELKGEVAQYNEMNGRSPAPDVVAQADAQAATSSAETDQAAIAAETQAALLSGTNSDQTTSLSIDANPAVTTRLSVSAQLSDQENFSGAPSLGRSFVAANEATAPLDVRQPQLASAAPAAPTNAGLDV